jgi:hypothetical protein
MITLNNFHCTIKPQKISCCVKVIVGWSILTGGHYSKGGPPFAPSLLGNFQKKLKSFTADVNI